MAAVAARPVQIQGPLLEQGPPGARTVEPGQVPPHRATSLLDAQSFHAPLDANGEKARRISPKSQQPRISLAISARTPKGQNTKGQTPKARHNRIAADLYHVPCFIARAPCFAARAPCFIARASCFIASPESARLRVETRVRVGLEAPSGRRSARWRGSLSKPWSSRTARGLRTPNGLRIQRILQASRNPGTSLTHARGGKYPAPGRLSQILRNPPRREKDT